MLFFPLSDSVQSQQLCFEKALLMSGWDHVAIHLSLCMLAYNLSLSVSFLNSFFLSCSPLQGCITSVEKWLLENCGVILGICVGVAVVEVSISLPH